MIRRAFLSLACLLAATCALAQSASVTPTDSTAEQSQEATGSLLLLLHRKMKEKRESDKEELQSNISAAYDSARVQTPTMVWLEAAKASIKDDEDLNDTTAIASTETTETEQQISEAQERLKSIAWACSDSVRDSAPIFYDLSGQRIHTPTKGGIYVTADGVKVSVVKQPKAKRSPRKTPKRLVTLTPTLN